MIKITVKCKSTLMIYFFVVFKFFLLFLCFFIFISFFFDNQTSWLPSEIHNYWVEFYYHSNLLPERFCWTIFNHSICSCHCSSDFFLSFFCVLLTQRENYTSPSWENLQNIFSRGGKKKNNIKTEKRRKKKKNRDINRLWRTWLVKLYLNDNNGSYKIRHDKYNNEINIILLTEFYCVNIYMYMVKVLDDDDLMLIIQDN